MEIRNKREPQNKQEAQLCQTKDGGHINGLGPAGAFQQDNLLPNGDIVSDLMVNTS